MSAQRNLVLGSSRELGTVGLVAGLSAGYAAVLVMASGFMSAAADASGPAVSLIMDSVAGVFVLIALYVATVVIVNCVNTVIAGRLRQIALLRLLGASGRDLRRTVTVGTLRVGAVGAVVGAVVAVALADVVRVVLVETDVLPRADYPWFRAQVVVGVLAVAAATALAGLLGSVGVLRVSAIEAMTGTSGAAARPTRTTSALRAVTSVLLLAGGAGLLVIAAGMGEQGSASGFLAAFFGAATTGTGLLVGARFVVPAIVGATGRLVGRGPAGRIARRNAVKDPLRTTRSTMGLIIGVTLVTTCTSGTAALRASLDVWDLTASQREAADHVMAMMSAIMVCIVVISSVIAAVGFVSTMSLTVIQRTREIGLLRAMGFTATQVRSMITREAVALAATAVAFGTLLGLVYGSVAAQSLVGMESPGLVIGLPWVALAVIAACGVALVLASSRVPSRRAVSIAPIDALHVDA